MPSKTLLGLPNDLLAMLPPHLRPADLYALIGTCRRFRSVCSCPIAVYREAREKYTVQTLIASKARTLGTWANESSANSTKLQSAIRGGPEVLLNCALRETGFFTRDELRALEKACKTVIQPVAMELVVWNKKQQCESSEEDCFKAVVNYWIYCDLFYEQFHARISGTEAMLPQDARASWLLHCVAAYPGDVTRDALWAIDCDRSGWIPLRELWSYVREQLSVEFLDATAGITLTESRVLLDVLENSGLRSLVAANEGTECQDGLGAEELKKKMAAAQEVALVSEPAENRACIDVDMAACIMATDATFRWAFD